MSVRGYLRATRLAALALLILPQIEGILRAEDTTVIPNHRWGNFDFGAGKVKKLNQQGLSQKTRGYQNDRKFGYLRSLPRLCFKIHSKGMDGLQEKDKQILQGKRIK